MQDINAIKKQIRRHLVINLVKHGTARLAVRAQTQDGGQTQDVDQTKHTCLKVVESIQIVGQDTSAQGGKQKMDGVYQIV